MQIRRITPKVIRKPKQRRCKNPACGEMYTPHHAAKSFECWCSPNCGTIIARQRALKAEAKKNAQARREHRAKKKSLKPLSKWLQEAQADFNAFIRLRDHDKPCISCGRTEGQDNLTGGYWHAGHYRTTAAQPGMRFNELNCHKQCPTCNNYKSGNLIEYRIGLVNRLGPELVEWLDRDHPQPSKWEIEEIRAIRDYYRGATKALRQYMAGEGCLMYSEYKTTEWLLTQWGLWANINAHPRHDYPHIEPHERMRRNSGMGCAISDADAERIDRIISGLREAHKNQQLALVLYYKDGKSYRGVAREMKTNVRRVSDLINGGRMWVDGAIQGVATLDRKAL